MPTLTRAVQADQTLLDLALAVHMASTGLSDVSPDREIHRILTLLEAANAHWEPSVTVQVEPFDDAVRALVRAAITEGRRWALTHPRASHAA